MRRPVVLAALVVVGAVGCGTTASRTTAEQDPTTASTSTTPSPTSSAPAPSPSRSLHDPAVRVTPTPTRSLHAPGVRATTAAATLPPFASSTSTVTAAELGATYRAGCPTGPSQLRELSLTYYGFDGAAHTGQLVVNAAYASQVTAAFADLYAHRFPIRSMITVDHYGGSDDKSTAADNTAGFNCRAAVGGDGSYSMHAYGEAIDVDPVENPYLYDGMVDPPNGAAYANRSDVRPGMAYAGGELVAAFARIGWTWGESFGDYQHFSTNGK